MSDINDLLREVSQTDRGIDLEERPRGFIVAREHTNVPVSPTALAQRLQVAEYQAADYRRLYNASQKNYERLLAERDELKRAVDKLVEATGGLTVDFQFQGQFTIAVLVDPISERVFTGAACCNAEDTFSPEIGKAISLGRAMNSRADYYSNAAFAR